MREWNCEIIHRNRDNLFVKVLLQLSLTTHLYIYMYPRTLTTYIQMHVREPDNFLETMLSFEWWANLVWSIHTRCHSNLISNNQKIAFQNPNGNEMSATTCTYTYILTTQLAWQYLNEWVNKEIDSEMDQKIQNERRRGREQERYICYTRGIKD